MIADLLFSIAGKKHSDNIDTLLTEILDTKKLTAFDSQHFIYTLKCSAEGSYPPSQYFSSMGYEAIRVTNSLSEIKVLVTDLKDFLYKEELTRSAISSINSSASFKELTEKLRLISENDVSTGDFDMAVFTAEIADLEEIEAGPHAVQSGISDIDRLTGGFQPGTLALYCAYTGQGKSTALVSTAFKAVKDGKKGAIFSLEVTPAVVKLQFLCRYCYDVHSFSVTPKEIMEKALSDSEKEKLDGLIPEFNKFIANKLLIVDESLLSKELLSSARKLNELYKVFDHTMGSLDFVAWDHLNQIDLMYKDLGNVAIRTITSATKTFLNTEGRHPVTIGCMQCNRDGYKRASKRDGKYDLVAIGDLNEAERSCVYAVFFYTSDDLKLLQETRVSLLKHRYGAVLSEPTACNFNAASFFVGEEIENTSFDGDFSFLQDSGSITSGASEFDEFE